MLQGRPLTEVPRERTRPTGKDSSSFDADESLT
jgi:hypothetical protein